MTILGGSDADADSKCVSVPPKSLDKLESETKFLRKSLDDVDRNKVPTKSLVIIMAKRDDQDWLSFAAQRGEDQNRHPGQGQGRNGNEPGSSSTLNNNYTPTNQGQYYYPRQPDSGYPQQQGANRDQAVVEPHDEEPEEVVVLNFNDKEVRRAFIRKVYSILMCQLLVTIGIIAIFLFVPVVANYTLKNPGLLYGVMALNIIVAIPLICCEGVRRSFPSNYIFLGLFTISEGLLLGAVSSTFSRYEVLLAVAITAIVAFSLTIFSFQTKYDFTMMGGILFVATIILLLFGITMIFLRHIFPILNAFYGALGALIFSVYLVYDTQLMMGGEHKYSISPEEHVFAALNLYLDIVNLFIYILTIFRSTDEN